MNFIQLLLLSISVALDAFAVSVAKGVAMPSVGQKLFVVPQKPTREVGDAVNSSALFAHNTLKMTTRGTMADAWLSGALCVGLWFGGFQTVMSAIGYFLGDVLAVIPKGLDSWIVFIIFTVLAINMVKEAFFSKPNKEVSNPLAPKKMAFLALATSIDSLAVGLTLALTSSSAFLGIGLIGSVTFVLSLAGFFAGALAGNKLESVSQLVGAAILFALGIKVLMGI